MPCGRLEGGSWSKLVAKEQKPVCPVGRASGANGHRTNRVTHQGMGLDGAPSEYELGALPSSSPFRSSTSSARRSPSTASASSFAHKLFCRPSTDELVLRAESPAARPSWGVEPAASIARRRRSRSCHGRRAREAPPGTAEVQKAPLTVVLSSDTTPSPRTLFLPP